MKWWAAFGRTRSSPDQVPHRTASEQFDAVNPSREHPNILVLVNHDAMSDCRDLREAVTGYFHADTGERFPP